MTREARHWIEYGVVFVIITAVATATAAWYTRKEWQSTTDNGRRQRRAYVFPDQDLRQQHHSGRLRGRPQGACHGVDRPADHRAGSRPSRRRPTPTTPLSSRRRSASWRRARPRRQARDGPPSVSEGPEAKLLIARQAFLCAAQLSEIAAWLAENGDSPGRYHHPDLRGWRDMERRDGQEGRRTGYVASTQSAATPIRVL